MPWSVVRKASNSATASRSKVPFCLPDQPRSLTVIVSTSAGRCRLSRRGMFSSSSTRMPGFRFLQRQLEEGNCLFPADTRKVLEEDVQSISRRQVLYQALYGNAGTREYQSSVHHLRVRREN